jgi:hypothetical protein
MQTLQLDDATSKWFNTPGSVFSSTILKLLTLLYSAGAFIGLFLHFSVECYADSSIKQVVKLGPETFHIPSDWLARYVQIELVTGQRFVHVPSSPGTEYVATSISLKAPPFQPAGTSSILPLPTQLDIQIISDIAAANYHATEKEYLAREARFRSSHASKDGDVWDMSPGLHMVLGSESNFRLGAPLVVWATLKLRDSDALIDRTAFVEYRISPLIHVRLMFDLRDFPPEKWRELDENVKQLINYLRQN